VTDGLTAAELRDWVYWQNSRPDVAGAVDKLAEQIKAWRRQ
jgi:hypothetical protein